MKTVLERQCEAYQQVNSVIGNSSVVLFGSTGLAQLPVAELLHCFGLNMSVSNRSMEGLTVREAPLYLEDCVVALHPNKVFLCFGDVELMEGTWNENEFFTDYQLLIEGIQNQCSGSIYLLSPMEALDTFRDTLRKLAVRTGCTYVENRSYVNTDRPMLHLFSILTHHIRNTKLNLGDAMGMTLHS